MHDVVWNGAGDSSPEQKDSAELHKHTESFLNPGAHVGKRRFGSHSIKRQILSGLSARVKIEFGSVYHEIRKMRKGMIDYTTSLRER